MQGTCSTKFKGHTHSPESEHLLKYGTLGALSPHSLAEIQGIREDWQINARLGK